MTEGAHCPLQTRISSVLSYTLCASVQWIETGVSDWDEPLSVGLFLFLLLFLFVFAVGTY